MSNRNARWTWLTLLALANVVCWLGVAGAIGLVVSREVDLGVETLIREGQATAVAFWSKASQRALRPTPLPTSAAQPSAPAPTNIAQGNAPADSVSVPANPLPTAPLPSQTAPAPQPQANLVTSPLLLADPEISSLTRLDAELDRSAPGRPVQIRYQEGALNDEIATLSKNNPDLPFRDVWVDFQRDGVVITGRTTVLGFRVNAEIEGTVEAQDCVPHLQIESVSVAGVLTPSFVRDQVKDLLLEAMTWYPADYPLCLEQIVLEETRASIYGYRR